MTKRLTAALREIFARADSYTALQFNAPLTHEMLRSTR